MGLGTNSSGFHEDEDGFQIESLHFRVKGLSRELARVRREHLPALGRERDGLDEARDRLEDVGRGLARRQRRRRLRPFPVLHDLQPPTCSEHHSAFLNVSPRGKFSALFKDKNFGNQQEWRTTRLRHRKLYERRGKGFKEKEISSLRGKALVPNIWHTVVVNSVPNVCKISQPPFVTVKKASF